ncbi:hypothetical protein FISHEDRAFT_76645 [Fistulina hepatica ATCC 64428]|uniref:DUF6697 domain-containing protein n=1 Tax=Fistulina hepatica ATCC 64428 TaxID=1128425 RepID=A0A0D7A417_9AGAR|nr:hypothetical protein FISHEDRAFT_76645 [Fistulina hepatica ATCC 64428]
MEDIGTDWPSVVRQVSVASEMRIRDLEEQKRRLHDDNLRLEQQNRELRQTWPEQDRLKTDVERTDLENLRNVVYARSTPSASSSQVASASKVAREAYAAHLNKAREGYHRMKEQMQAQKEEAARQQQRISDLEAELKTLKRGKMRAVDDMSDELAALNEQLHRYQVSQTELQERNLEQQREIERLSSDLEGARRQLTQAQSMLKSVATRWRKEGARPVLIVNKSSSVDVAPTALPDFPKHQPSVPDRSSLPVFASAVASSSLEQHQEPPKQRNESTPAGPSSSHTRQTPQRQQEMPHTSHGGRLSVSASTPHLNGNIDRRSMETSEKDDRRSRVLSMNTNKPHQKDYSLFLTPIPVARRRDLEKSGQTIVKYNENLERENSFDRATLAVALGGSSRSVITSKTSLSRENNISCYLCPALFHNPWTPRNPGQHGYMFVGLGSDRGTFIELETCPLFVKFGEKDYRFMGVYAATRDKDLSVEEWENLSEEVRSLQVPMPPNFPFSQMKATYCKTTKEKEYKDRDTMSQAIRAKYDEGLLRVPCVRLICVGAGEDLLKALIGIKRTVAMTNCTPSKSTSKSAPGAVSRSPKRPRDTADDDADYDGDREVLPPTTLRRSARKPKAPRRASVLDAIRDD